MYLFLKDKDFNMNSASRNPISNSKTNRWIIFPLRPVEGVLCEHGIAKITSETEYYFKIVNVEAPKWKKHPTWKGLRRIKKMHVTEFYPSYSDAKKRTEYINKIVKQYNESMKKNIAEINNSYSSLVIDYLNTN